MSLSGPEFYDNDGVFDRYSAQRGDPETLNETMEGPAVWDLVGDPAGLAVVDLGCGAAAFGRLLLGRGAASYLGVEGSRNMAEAARRTLAGTDGEIICQPLEAWEPAAGAFDLAVSRLVFHYLADLPALLGRIWRGLRPGGRLVYSTQHPVLTAQAAGEGEGPSGSWVVDDYFAAGPRSVDWLGATVRIFHRTIEQHVAALRGAGFALEDLREAAPRPELFADPAELARRRRVPLFLVLAARKPIA
ncbi:MAG TPA: class I SAM-dependent methyltransferase [Herpetosiphonaceae bacterium]